MKKFTMILMCGLMIAAYATVSYGQTESVIWMDVRSNEGNNNAANANLNPITGTLGGGGNQPFTNEAINSGRRGAGQTLYLEPVRPVSMGHTLHANSFPNAVDPDGDRSNGSLWVYMDVSDDPAGTGDVIASLGLDVQINPPGTVRNHIGSMTFELFNDDKVMNQAGGGQIPWNNKINGAVVGGAPAPQWAGAKAVRVPVAAGPSYMASLGLQPTAWTPSSTVMPYRVGRLRVQAGTRGCPLGGANTTNSTYQVFLKVNNLKIARVFDGAGDNPPEEWVSFGYNAGVVDPPISGNIDGQLSATPDATIVIQVKGDFTGDGRITSGDNGPMGTAAFSVTNDKVRESFFGDFTGDSRVNSADPGPYNAAAAATLPCPG